MTRAARMAIIMSIFAVAIRLIGINQPFEDKWSWRQSDVAAIARNYSQAGFHFACPQIDWAGNSGGYVGTEFPILPFVAAICYKIFGVHEWIGRIQAVIFFAISLPFFFLLVRDHLGKLAAVWALLFYSLAPLGIMASRCFMPDTPSLALSIIGLYFFDRWVAHEKSAAAFVASAVCISLSILIKATSVLVVAPLVCLAFQRFSLSAFRRFRLWVFAAIALVPSVIWYWHAYQVSLHFYPHHFFGAGGVKVMSPGWYWKIAKEILTSELTPILVVLAAVGFVIARSTELRPRLRLFDWWLGAMILFIVVVGYGNRHPWYQLPLVPIAAVFAGIACAFISERIPAPPARLAAAISLVTLYGLLAFGSVNVFYRPLAGPLRNAGLELNRITPSNALIAVADNGDPTVLYYAARKGWHFLEKEGIYYGDPPDGPQAVTNLEQLRAMGANYVAFTSNTAWWLDLYPELSRYVDANSALVAKTSQFTIYRFNPKSE